MPLTPNPSLCPPPLTAVSTHILPPAHLCLEFVWLFLLAFYPQALFRDIEALFNLALAFLIKTPCSSSQPHKNRLRPSSIFLRLVPASAVQLTWIRHNYRDTSIGQLFLCLWHVSFLSAENKSAKSHLPWNDGFQCSPWFANYSTTCKNPILALLKTPSAQSMDGSAEYYFLSKPMWSLINPFPRDP